MVVKRALSNVEVYKQIQKMPSVACLLALFIQLAGQNSTVVIVCCCISPRRPGIVVT